MDRIRRTLKRRDSASYEPLHDEVEDDHERASSKRPFSRLEYSIFLVMGISMLWAWYEASSTLFHPISPFQNDQI